jgi:hypothetical protein
MSRLEDVGPSTEVDSSPTPTTMEEDNAAGLKEVCGPDGTWAEHP